MTAGEDEAQALVTQFARRVALRACVVAFSHTNQLFAAIVEASLAPDSIDCLVPRDADDPRARILRETIAAPLLDRSLEGVMSGVLGQREISEHADKRGDD